MCDLGKQESLPGKEYPFYMSAFSNEMDAPCMFHVADALFQDNVYINISVHTLCTLWLEVSLGNLNDSKQFMRFVIGFEKHTTHLH